MYLRIMYLIGKSRRISRMNRSLGKHVYYFKKKNFLLAWPVNCRTLFLELLIFHSLSYLDKSVENADWVAEVTTT